jgi:hypothetical protein
MMMRKLIRAVCETRRAAYAVLAALAIIIQSFGPLAAAELRHTDLGASIVICTADGLKIVPADSGTRDSDPAPSGFASHCEFGVCSQCGVSFSIAAIVEFNAFPRDTSFHGGKRDDPLTHRASLPLFRPRAPPTV